MRKKASVYVFGYGSLVDQIGKPGVTFANLRGSVRKWDVAMDNSKIVPGYKYYIDPLTRMRPPVFVTFLNVSLDEPMDSKVNGMLIPVDEELVLKLDSREWNYDRVDITERISPCPKGAVVYTYAGKAEARLRFINALQANTAIVHKNYQEIVENGFKELGPKHLESYQRSTIAHELPLMDLKFVKSPEKSNTEQLLSIK